MSKVESKVEIASLGMFGLGPLALTPLALTPSIFKVWVMLTMMVVYWWLKLLFEEYSDN